MGKKSLSRLRVGEVNSEEGESLRGLWVSVKENGLRVSKQKRKRGFSFVKKKASELGEPLSTNHPRVPFVVLVFSP